MAGGDGPPIFVVGCQRSGTTLLRLLLDSHPRLSCGPETRFLTDLARITGSDWSRLSRYGFPKEFWHQHIAAFFDEFQLKYATSRGKSRWADKTPLYALSLDFLNEVFPTCQIIHVVRDGRDVVTSHRQRWGYRSAVKAAFKWPRYIETARKVGRELPPDRYLEVRYEDLVRNPEPTLRQLCSFLGEPWAPEMLDYERAPHDVPDRYKRLSAVRRSTSDGASIYNSRVGAHRKDLDPFLRVLVNVVSGRTLTELGYR